MELVYLWVEDYKNIHRQGFNFSPRFECHYDENTNELIIDENKEHVSIFPENINVTAIVGENGSGKSSLLLSFIENLIPNKIKRSNFNEPCLKINQTELYCSLFTIYYQNNNFYGYLTNHPKPANNFSIDFETSRDIFTFYYNLNTPVMNIRNNNFSLSPFESILYQKDKNYSNDLLKEDESNITKNLNLLYNRKFAMQNMKEFDLTNNYRKITDNIIKFYLQENITLSIIQNFFIPVYYNLNFYLEKIGVFRNGNSYWERNYKTYDEDPIRKEIKVLAEAKKCTFESLERNDLISISYLHIISEIINNFIQIDSFTEKGKELFKGVPYRFENEIQIILKDLTQCTYDDIFEIEYEYIKRDFDFIEYIKSLDNTSVINSDKNIIDYKFLIKLPYWIEIELITEKNLTLKDLSYGQKILTVLSYNILYSLSSIKYYKKDKFITLIFDEIELSFHPNWQKKFINMLLSLLKAYNKKIDNYFEVNILIATHSPFFLSDLPKENVIFLKKGKLVKGIEKKQTFGANIHTLLSDSFFMKDGLMGEFAKERIQSIIKFHEEIEKKEILEADKIEYKTKKQKEFWHIQSIIGDDYLKQVIKNHLIEIEKIVLGNDDAKIEEIKRLKAQIELLEK